jgi:ABC-type metal ion transport system substrate-binding protein
MDLLAQCSAGCASWLPPRKGRGVLRIGVSPVPHAETLEQMVASFARRGVYIRILNFDDYIQPNIALASGELDAKLC